MAGEQRRYRLIYEEIEDDIKTSRIIKEGVGDLGSAQDFIEAVRAIMLASGYQQETVDEFIPLGE